MRQWCGLGQPAFGVQNDNVIDMEVVTGEGSKVTCSASNNADLLNAVRAGLGQVGVIAKATLKLVAAPESVHRFLLVYPDQAGVGRQATAPAETSVQILRAATYPE